MNGLRGCGFRVMLTELVKRCGRVGKSEVRVLVSSVLVLMTGEEGREKKSGGGEGFGVTRPGRLVSESDWG